jgi:pimeloyl-ACP methyl ester carboxylesterase
VVVPDLRGFGESDRHLLDPDTFYSPSAQARSIADRIRDYLHHFWQRWTGADFVVDTADFEHLVDRYARLGAFESTSNWYRVGAGYVANALAEQAPEGGARLTIPVRVLWQELDPFFPRAWADRLGDFFADVTVLPVDGIGHFTPLEAPREFAATVKAASEACSSAELAKGRHGERHGRRP